MVQGDPWETVKGGVDKVDAEMCKAWNGELDTILTFVCVKIALLPPRRPDMST